MCQTVFFRRTKTYYISLWRERYKSSASLSYDRPTNQPTDQNGRTTGSITLPIIYEKEQWCLYAHFAYLLM